MVCYNNESICDYVNMVKLDNYVWQYYMVILTINNKILDT